MKTLVLDSNVFIRYLTGDVKAHYEEARGLFEEIESGEIVGQVSVLVINEVIWILQNFYKFKRSVFVPQLLKIFGLKNLRIIEVKKSLVVKILKKFEETNFDFTDLYLAEITTRSTLFSFDRDFKKIFS